MNLGTAKKEELEKLVAALREQRDALFEAERVPEPLVLDCRKRAVSLKRAINRGENVAENSKALEAVELERSNAASARDGRRRAIKIQLRAAELELKRRGVTAMKSELSNFTVEELKAFIGATVDDCRAKMQRAKAAQAVLDDRLATEKFLGLAANLTAEERARLIQQLTEEQRRLANLEPSKDGK